VFVQAEVVQAEVVDVENVSCCPNKHLENKVPSVARFNYRCSLKNVSKNENARPPIKHFRIIKNCLTFSQFILNAIIEFPTPHGKRRNQAQKPGQILSFLNDVATRSNYSPSSSYCSPSSRDVPLMITNASLYSLSSAIITFFSK
jgi:hypothetical protein